MFESASTHLLRYIINLHRDLHFNRRMIRSTVFRVLSDERLPRDLHRPYLHIGTGDYEVHSRSLKCRLCDKSPPGNIHNSNNTNAAFEFVISLARAGCIRAREKEREMHVSPSK